MNPSSTKRRMLTFIIHILSDVHVVLLFLVLRRIPFRIDIVNDEVDPSIYILLGFSFL